VKQVEVGLVLEHLLSKVNVDVFGIGLVVYLERD
jgi:hypothetical protein